MISTPSGWRRVLRSRSEALHKTSAPPRGPDFFEWAACPETDLPAWGRLARRPEAVRRGGE